MKKENAALVISIVILVIAAGISFQNYQNAKQSRRQINELENIVHEKNEQIIKLIKDINKRR